MGPKPIPFDHSGTPASWIGGEQLFFKSAVEVSSQRCWFSEKMKAFFSLTARRSRTNFHRSASGGSSGTPASWIGGEQLFFKSAVEVSSQRCWFSEKLKAFFSVLLIVQSQLLCSIHCSLQPPSGIFLDTSGVLVSLNRELNIE